MPDQPKPVADLTNMNIGEVAVCRRGMNPGAVVALFKADLTAAPSASPSTTNEASTMPTNAPGGAPPVTKAGDPPPFNPCPDCKDPAGCTKAGGCAIDKGCGDKTKDPMSKGSGLVVPSTAPAADPFAKSVKEIMDDLFKGVANPPVGLYAGIAKAVADAKEIGAAEVKKATDAFAAGNAKLAKADDDAKTFGEVLPAEMAMQDWWRFNDALYSSLRSILESSETDEMKLQMVMTSLEQFKNAVTRRMAAAIAASAAATDALLKGAPAGATAPATTTSPAPVNKEDPAVSGTANTPNLSDVLAKAGTVEDIIKALPDGAAKIITDAIAKAKAEGAAPAEDPIAKAIAADPALKARFETLEKAAADAAAIAKAAQDRHEHGERVSKAKTDFGNLPIAADAMADVLKAVDGIADETVRKNLETVLKAGNEAIGKNVLGGEIGKGGTGTGAGTAEAKVIAKAEELRKADASLTHEQAIIKVYEGNPALYDEVQKELSARRGG